MAIRPAESKILASVAAFGKIKDSQYGEGRKFQSVLFESDHLPEGKHWKSMSPADAQGFRKGQQVWLVPVHREGRETFDIEIPSQSTTAQSAQVNQSSHSATPQPIAHRPLTPGQKRQVAEFITDVAAIQAFCWDQASAAMTGKGVNEAVIQAFASGLAISTMRRFGLDSGVEFAPEPGACNSAPQNTHSTVAPPTAQPGAQPRKRPGVTYSPPKMRPEKEALAQRVMSPAGASVWQGQGEDF